MKLDKITFVTGNKKKVTEVQQILNIPLEIMDIELDEIQESNLERIAMHKLNQAFSIIKKPVIVDDVSVSIDAWNGFPGPLIKWILKAGDGGPDLLLKLLENEQNRKATASLAIGFHDGKTTHLFIGEARGTIARKIVGENGLGWDGVFIPEEKSETYAQMPVDEKNAISHRRKALDKLSDFLKANYDI
jgi:XTP/dITP diphosphohydrolase